MQTLVLAYLAGALTTLNLCVLPMIPFVLATALREGRYGPLALMAGMSVTFTLLGTLVASIGPATGLSQDNIRIAGALVMVVIGLAMLIPQGQAAFATGLGPLADRASGMLDRLSLSGNAGQFVTGLLLGAVWSPCAGPSLFAPIGLIELVRGVRLISILFMAQLMLPLFLPDGWTVDRVVRAMVGITLFSAAYLAENVRGGLQAIPKGQFEAAEALGLSGAQTMVFIILPQALRLIIPILVGQFIALFKDTSLVAIVGLLELLGMAKTVLAQPEFLGLQREVYVFISLIFWVLSYGMSYLSQQLEVRLGVGSR